MVRYTPNEFELYLRPKLEADTDIDSTSADEGPESRLQGKIVKYCKDHGYPCLSFRQSRKAQGFLKKGWADITILLPESRVLFLELKSSKGIMRAEQKGLKQIASFFHQEWYKITSYRQFLGIMEAKE